MSAAISPVLVLMRSTLLEARRGGLPWLALACLAVALALAAFVSHVALTEGAALQAALLGALLRAGAVFLVAAQVIASTLREMHDRGLELMLSLAHSRTTHYVGRLAGFVVCAALLAVLFAVPLLAWAPPVAVAIWALSLACEAALVAAAALFFAMSLGQFAAAIAPTIGLYLLARSIGAIQAIASGPLADASLAARIAQYSVDGVALLLPPLDALTRTAWLLYEPPAPGVYAAALGSAVLYIVLLAAAGLFDFHRRSL